MKKQLMISLKFLLVMTILTGLVYPLLMTGLSWMVYPSKAGGSLVYRNGKLIGSALIGQKFDNEIYFWSRPSESDYNPIPSGGSNLGPTSDTLKKLVAERKKIFAGKNGLNDSLNVPNEMIFASGSGLDPDISRRAALLQVDRITKARHFNETQQEDLIRLIEKMTTAPQFHLLGEQRINVLKLNIALDELNINKPIK
jgi:potassium-transporting ATPase KdpC subunit